jgi:hypothetical protein
MGQRAVGRRRARRRRQVIAASATAADPVAPATRSLSSGCRTPPRRRSGSRRGQAAMAAVGAAAAPVGAAAAPVAAAEGPGEDEPLAVRALVLAVVSLAVPVVPAVVALVLAVRVAADPGRPQAALAAPVWSAGGRPGGGWPDRLDRLAAAVPTGHEEPMAVAVPLDVAGTDTAPTTMAPLPTTGATGAGSEGREVASQAGPTLRGDVRPHAGQGRLAGEAASRLRSRADSARFPK